MLTPNLVAGLYLVSGVLFILALRGLSSPATSRQGNYFGMLGMTSRALDAQRYGLDVVGNNLANVNTPGYTKRVADFGAVPPPDRFS